MARLPMTYMYVIGSERVKEGGIAGYGQDDIQGPGLMGATPNAPQEAASGTVEPWQKTAPCDAPRGVKWRLPFRVPLPVLSSFLAPVVVVALL